MAKLLEIWTDGSIEGGNPGGHGVSGWVVKGLLSIPVTGVKDLGQSPTMTNNVAEYTAVKSALEWVVRTVKTEQFDKVLIRSDSQLVVNQCNDEWKCNDKRLGAIRDDIWHLCENIPIPVEFKWIPREENMEADEVSRRLYK